MDKVAKNRRSLAVRPVLVRNCPQIMQWREVCFQGTLEKSGALHRQFETRKVTLAKLSKRCVTFPARLGEAVRPYRNQRRREGEDRRPYFSLAEQAGRREVGVRALPLTSSCRARRSVPNLMALAQGRAA